MSGASDKYRLDQRLGGGGMAEVFLASTVGAEGFSRKVAIKRVLPGYSDNAAFAQMFISEAKISSRLVHPNIVSVIDFDRDAEHRLYLVMELVEGRDLDSLIWTGLLPIPLVIYVISEVLRGLGHAHDLPLGPDTGRAGPGQATITTVMRGVVHRDVSPHNVLLSWQGAVKVSDFGIAKARSASEATASTFIKGKPAYMSPEQANGQPLDGRSDLYAVGIMLWEMLCGRRLFVGEDTRAVLAAVLFGQIPRPRSVRGDIPKDLERVVMKLLERDLPARYANADEAIADLLECDAAPRDGRALLKRTLAERFPDQAPVTQGQLLSRSGQTPSVVPQGTPNPRGTAADGSGGGSWNTPGPPPASSWNAPPQPAASLPSVGAMRMAPTGSLPLVPPRRRFGLVAILALVLPLSGLATFGIVSLLKGKHGGAAGDAGALAAAGSGAGSGAAGSAGATQPAAGAAGSAGATQPAAGSGTHAATVAAPPDAGAPPPAPIDAAPPAHGDEAPGKKDATSPVRAHAGAHKQERYGRLAVHAFPALTVFVDKKRIHDTPVSMKLPVGPHVLRLINTEVGHDETVTITITEHHTTTIGRE